MHELSLSLSIVKTISDKMAEDGISKVKSVILHLGQFSGVDKECMEFAWDSATNNSVLSGSKLKIEVFPLKIKCNSCKKVGPKDMFALICEHCDSTDVEIISGQEFLIKRLEV